MTELLQQVISEIQKLPAEQQNANPTGSEATASRLMPELKDEQKWTEQFESTTDEQWDRLADIVRQEIASSDTTPLDEVFPVKS